MRRTVVVLAALLTLSGAQARAQAAGTLVGAVRTAEGTPVPNLVLLLRGPAVARSVVTGPEGRYRAAFLAPGHYRLEPRMRGFLLSGSAETDVAAGETSLDVTLAPAPVREHVVVAATRDEAPVSTVGVTVTVLDSARIAEREAPSLLALLEEVPGVVVARNGGLGLQGVPVRSRRRVELRSHPRGRSSRQRAGGGIQPRPLLPLELERVEVVRGAASSLYGTDALAGVVHLVTRRHPAAARWRGDAQAGGFGWRRGGGAPPAARDRSTGTPAPCISAPTTRSRTARSGRMPWPLLSVSPTVPTRPSA